MAALRLSFYIFLVGQKQHGDKQDGTHHRGDDRGDVNGTVGNAKAIGAVTKGAGKHIGIDYQDVNHGKKGGHAGNKRGFRCCALFFQLKIPFLFYLFFEVIENL